ncbi:hypothetical protein C8R44DRAFT_736869 [Mycena epipterygia]|nr:hypothetical protein C8R44DRAFT_736869 [Mycena epipterygia]
MFEEKHEAVGRNLTAHNVPAKCIKPFRGLDEMPLTKFRTRVVIIGPDITGDGTFKGLYGETQPPITMLVQKASECDFKAAVNRKSGLSAAEPLPAENVEIQMRQLEYGLRRSSSSWTCK